MTFKELREKSGMTQTQFAAYFDIPRRTVQSWDRYGIAEDGRKCPEYLLRLMEYKLDQEGLIRADMGKGNE